VSHAVEKKETRSRGSELFTLAVLAAAALWLLVHVYEFGQTRFFTVDEYQYAHATWLVSRGQVPYADFYEHHFPGSYVLHAPALPESGSMASRALRLRAIPFAYIASLTALLVLGTWTATRNAHVALLTAILPLVFGFSAMSAIEYRADNFGAFLFLACLSLLEANRTWKRRSAAAVGGVLLALSILMTQKMVFLGGGAVALMLAADALRRRRPRGEVRAWIAHPGAFAAGGIAVAAAALAAALALGLLPAAFELTIVQAIEHEAHYPPISVRKYAEPFLARTAATTLPMLFFAAVQLARRPASFWSVPVLVALVCGSLVTAQYPYNYVLLCSLLMVCAARGYGWTVERFAPRAAAWRTLLYLLPLAALPNQLAFLSGTTSNAHQLHLLDKLERYSSENDVVLDGAGGAIFRKHASYYWYHGVAHREILADYFREGLLRDLRESRARFWIKDFRLPKISPEIRRYLYRHYVRADGQLFVLGFATPQTDTASWAGEIDVIRSGVYFAYAGIGRTDAAEGPAPSIDGRPVGREGVRLEEGLHRVSVPPGAPAGVITPLPRGVFEDPMPQLLPHAPLFEYDPQRR
jgi:hypothetical protein